MNCKASYPIIVAYESVEKLASLTDKKFYQFVSTTSKEEGLLIASHSIYALLS
jgi:hypothetical protein